MEISQWLATTKEYLYEKNLVRIVSFEEFYLVLFPPSSPHFCSSPENQQFYNNGNFKKQ